jgi:hypothetical protein
MQCQCLMNMNHLSVNLAKYKNNIVRRSKQQQRKRRILRLKLGGGDTAAVF